jgi:hypothetical protein
VGAAWYQREITVPADWSSGRIELTLERVMVTSRLWIDGVYCGESDSLSTPHRYDLSGHLRPGKRQTVTLRIDNRDIHKLHSIASGYTEDTQSIWNGVVGAMELRALPKIGARIVVVTASAGDSRAEVELLVTNTSGETCPILATLEISDRESPTGFATAARVRLSAGPGERRERIEVEVSGHFIQWNEFQPKLYAAKATIGRDDGSEGVLDADRRSFGCREISRRGRSICLGERPLFLRGTLDCCVFPQTGHPPMDRASWERYFRQLQEFGLNHVRFHSWCPPEAAFAAADTLGLYLQIEPPVWLDDHNCPLGSYPEHYEFIPREAERIIQTYGHHPSFVIFSLGNELNGDFDFLRETVRQLRELDRSRLYTLTSNWDRPAEEEDEVYIAQSADGVGLRGQYSPERMARGTELVFDDAIRLRELPTISHEIGQYAVYPNVAEIEQYHGPLAPVNLEAIRLDLLRRGMIHQTDTFVDVSGRFAALLYKAEIEAALATEDMAGFQLLGLQDYPGQSTATIGLIDSLGATKPFTSPKWFHRFCAPRTILFLTEHRVLSEGETLRGYFRLANHASPFSGGTLNWTLTDPATGRSTGGALAIEATKAGRLSDPLEISLSLSEAWNAPAALLLSVELADGSARNEWIFWLYPAPETALISDERVLTSVDEATRRRLEAGERLLLIPEELPRRNGIEMGFYPVFWSPVHFETKTPCGLICDKTHPALAGFPTEAHSDFQWYELTRESFALEVDEVADWLTPIVSAVPNFFHNRRLGVVFELPILAGRLLVCTLPLRERAGESPAAAALLKSLFSYVERGAGEDSAADLPAGSPVSWEAVERLFA